MHLIHLTYYHSLLSLPYLKCAQDTYISLQRGKITEHTKYNVENWLFTLMIMWLTGGWLTGPAQNPESIALLARKRSIFKVRFLLKVCRCYIIIKSKNPKLNIIN